MLYTRTGDDGTTTLNNGTERLPKDNAVCEALGTLEELNALLGVCRASCLYEEPLPLRQIVRTVQETLFSMHAMLAGAETSIGKAHVLKLEEDIAILEAHMQPVRSVVIPGSTLLSAQFDHARAVCRRAERRVVALSYTTPYPEELVMYLNRASSLLYALARHTATMHGAPELKPSYL